ncbi:uncharacterized protein LOC144782600 [Lissotriton helveticus]
MKSDPVPEAESEKVGAETAEESWSEAVQREDAGPEEEDAGPEAPDSRSSADQKEGEESWCEDWWVPEDTGERPQLRRVAAEPDNADDNPEVTPWESANSKVSPMKSDPVPEAESEKIGAERAVESWSEAVQREDAGPEEEDTGPEAPDVRSSGDQEEGEESWCEDWWCPEDAGERPQL